MKKPTSIEGEQTFTVDYETGKGSREYRPTVAVLLPTYCEAENIESLIRELQKLELNLLIVVIDDSSPDGTASRARRLQGDFDNIVVHIRPTKLGLGTAITDGFRLMLSLKNPPNYVITMDADYSHDPKDIPGLVNVARENYDMVIGSRYCRGGIIVGWSYVRRLISQIANFVASAMVGMHIRDCTSGLRCYSLRYIQNVIRFLHSQTYEIQIETLKQAWAQGFKIRELPVTFTNRKRGKSKLTLDEIRAFLVYILKAACKI